MPFETPSDGLDLASMNEAAEAVDAAAARAVTAALRARMEGDLAALPPSMRSAMEQLIKEMGRIGAHAEAAWQAATEARRSRGEWLQIDPLRHLPEDRAAPPPPPPTHIELRADDPDFIGFGWHPAERNSQESWRWSGLAPAASIILPDLGLGGATIELDVIFPFGYPFDLKAVTILADGEPLQLSATQVRGSYATLTAFWEGREVAGGNLGLVILGPSLMSPKEHDTRRLGLGVRRLCATRMTRR
ncbi:hypothetical protein [Roseomonas xinghualingensis]|uniref:hypothetical protein n=1 Tax=Roseomonas xinghualingensis TaxID=2986475 RepID=UPI0021F10F4A|nr:hypothetical protein [Roseomonas sp. SXEYE001]MCV4208666.1 hypothetical protein [Roseomonas sp. SXEYE001]